MKHFPILLCVFSFALGIMLGAGAESEYSKKYYTPKIVLAERKAEACGESLKFQKFLVKEATEAYVHATGKTLEVKLDKYIKNYYRKPKDE
ncbi:hypothetical protein N9948_01710 [bacterium]|nr:hypothetical protein [bacterium]